MHLWLTSFVCSVSDLRTEVENVVNNPSLITHAIKMHEAAVNHIYNHADTSGRKKRKRAELIDPLDETPAVTALQNKLDGIHLKSWE